MCCCVGVPGPRVPMDPQRVELIDEVCWFFPELKFVMRHGAEPWTELAVKLMLKWPNLYYSTSAFAPRYYPKAVVDFANSRGANKVMYAGYFPMGLSLDRIFKELPNVPFNDDVWPKFLRENGSTSSSCSGVSTARSAEAAGFHARCTDAFAAAASPEPGAGSTAGTPAGTSCVHRSGCRSSTT